MLNDFLSDLSVQRSLIKHLIKMTFIRPSTLHGKFRINAKAAVRQKH